MGRSYWFVAVPLPNVRPLGMALPSLRDLLNLPPHDRAELAMALWESLDEAEKGAEFVLSDAEAAELDRRWAEHEADPDSSLRWEDVRERLRRLG